MVRTSGLLCAVLAACSFTPSGDGDPPIDAPTDDGAVDDATATDAAIVDAAVIDAPDIDAAPPIDAPPPIDARPIDAAPPIDAPPMCPASYTSGYRLISTATTWRGAETDCEDDSTGLTHLVVINNQAELDGINAAIGVDIWVGVVRDPVAVDLPINWRWRWVTGGAAMFLPWETGQPDNQSNNQYVVSLINSSGLLRDVDIGTTTNRAALCECDRMPPVDADYMNP